MGVLKVKYKKIPAPEPGRHLFSIDSSDFERFSPAVLGLGDFATPGGYVDALAAVFDLEGFTAFCNQSDPHLATPEFLSEFLRWLFDRISTDIKVEERGKKSILWASLPFFSKFMGDGILFLWNTSYANSNRELGNIVLCLGRVCEGYVSTFQPRLKAMVSRVPPRLRCGIARGRVISVGNGNDFVGPCINIASRLQKLGPLTFSFARKGMNPDVCFGAVPRKRFMTKRVSIRGLGDDELVVILKTEFDILSTKEKELFSNP